MKGLEQGMCLSLGGVIIQRKRWASLQKTWYHDQTFSTHRREPKGTFLKHLLFQQY